MANTARIDAWVRANPNRLITIGVSLLVVGSSIWMGTKARTASRALAEKRTAWEQTASRLATIQQQFRVPTATESATLVAESSQMGALGVPEAEKLNLVDAIGRLAEACSLDGVRVNSIPASDSAWVAERSIAGSRVKPADYAIAVEFGGSFANAVKFVSSLPPSVSLSRMRAGQRTGGPTYLLVLSVYELDANPGN